MPASLKSLLHSARLEFLMEAHNGLSARIVAEAGFSGIWASGLAISSSLGLRDCNEASWSELLQQVVYMRESVDIPILMDGDSGFGDFNSVRRLVKKLDQQGIDGLCIEDKVFPKRNSFMASMQQLADIPEFVGKIKAAKDSQQNPDFCLVARLEGFIAGIPLAAVLERAACFVEAGADAILVHSSRPDASEILAFAAQWSDPTPLVIVPTTYPDVTSEIYRAAGISMAIWANHNLRASISAMQSTCKKIFEQQSVAAVDDSIASIAEVLRIQDCAELYEAEQRYLHASEHVSEHVSEKDQ